MGKLITLLVLAAAGYGIYFYAFHQSPAFKTYLAYCAATQAGDCGTLYTLVDGKAKEWVDSFCTDAGGMTVMGQTIRGKSAAAMAAELASTPQGAMMQIKHESQSEDGAADGSIKLVALETPLGRTTNFSHPGPPHRHTVTLKEIGGALKIVEFVETEVPL